MERFTERTVHRRIAFLFLAVSLLAMLLVGRLWYLQVYAGPALQDKALNQRASPVPLMPNRGTIYDRNMMALATSFSAEAAYAVPVEVEDREHAAAVLAPILGVEYDWLLDRLSRSARYVWLALELDPETARAVREARLVGIYLVERPARFYPYGTLAANVLGFAGVDNQGLEGLELQYDKVLRGTEGMILRERDARGQAIPDGLHQRIDPEDGNSIVLTIDYVIQHIVERELKRGVLEAQAELGIFVALDPRTGEVLAMAQYPTYDPNEFQNYDSSLWKNRAVTDQFEPGSTFKTFTAATALELGVATLESEYDDPVRLVRWGGVVNCWRHGGHGHQTFVEATENSCNPIFALMGAEDIGPQNFRKYVNAFNFGQRLGIDFPGEARGTVPSRDSLLTWANVGFGQGIAATPLQMAAALAAVANGGILYQPYLVKEVRDAAGNVIERREPTPLRRVISEATAEDMIFTLRSVVVNGSGSAADAEGFRVAGKTGTAQIPEGGVYIDLNMATFVGFAPADDPVFVGVVMLYKVHATPSWGGTWAAPVFGRIVEQVLDYMGVPRRIEQQPANVQHVTVPNVRNQSVDEAVHLLEDAGLHVAFEGVGSYVLDVFPLPGAQVRVGDTVVIYFHDEPLPDPEPVVVPDIVGLSMEEAARRLQDAGLRIRIEGTGVAQVQQPAAGSTVPSRSYIEVQFQPPVP